MINVTLNVDIVCSNCNNVSKYVGIGTNVALSLFTKEDAIQVSNSYLKIKKQSCRQCFF